MKRKLIVTENQLKVITNLVIESTDHATVVKKLEADLNKNYDRVMDAYRDGNNYKERPAFRIKFSDEVITPEKLIKYLKLEYNYGTNFLEQVLNDWAANKIKNGVLSKNVRLYD